MAYWEAYTIVPKVQRGIRTAIPGHSLLFSYILKLRPGYICNGKDATKQFSPESISPPSQEFFACYCKRGLVAVKEEGWTSVPLLQII